MDNTENHGQNFSGHPQGRFKILVRGAVQGVGFRPFVFRLAIQLSRSWTAKLDRRAS